MKSQINILRQLQELVLTRDEHHQTGDGSHLDALNDSISALQRKLEPQVAGIYENLYKKSHVFISAMTNNCCAVCGMQVPIAHGQQVRIAQHLVTCSSCGRILFADDDAVVNTAEAPDRDSPKTGVSRFSAEELMIADLDASTREEAIARLAERMEQSKFISNADSLVTAALERESILSTAIDGGIAFPHVRGVEGGGLIQSHHFMGNRWGNSGNSVRLYFLGGSKITADGDCSHEIKRSLLLGRKVMTNLDSIFKSRDITLPTKVRLVKAIVFPVVM